MNHVTPNFIINQLKKFKRKKKLSNYKPIFVLPVMSKILERAVHTQLMDYLKKHNFIMS